MDGGNYSSAHLSQSVNGCGDADAPCIADKLVKWGKWKLGYSNRALKASLVGLNQDVTMN
jgi:fucose permease